MALLNREWASCRPSRRHCPHDPGCRRPHARAAQRHSCPNTSSLVRLFEAPGLELDPRPTEQLY